MTIGKRNFFGGFLAGILGILACAWLHPASMPMGCLLGVVVGFWNAEIWRKGRSISFKIKWPDWKIETLDAVHAWSAITILVLNLVGVFIALWITTKWFPLPQSEAVVILATIGITLLACPIVIATFDAMEQEYICGLQAKYSDQKKSFFWADLLFMMKRECWGSFRNTTYMLYVIGSICLFLTVFVAVAIPVAIIRGLIWAAQRSEQWFCFWTTIVVTTLTAIFSYQYWTNQTWIWLSALTAGLGSGTLSYVLTPYRLRIKVPDQLTDDTLDKLAGDWLGFFTDDRWGNLRAFFKRKNPDPEKHFT